MKKINNKKKTLAIVLARVAASRLPGKVLKKILGKPILQILIERIKDSESLDGIVVATSVNKEDDIIEEFCKKNNINVFRGNEKDVLERIYFAAKAYNADVIVEQGADCPLVDADLIDSALEFYFNNNFDYVTTLHNNRNAPHGYFLRICPMNILEDVYNTTTTQTYDREDTLFYIESHPELYRIGNFIPKKDTHAKDFRLTIDHPQDFELIKLILEHFNSIKTPMKKIVKYLKNNPDLTLINRTFHHREYKLYRIGMVGSYDISNDNSLLLSNLSQYKNVNEYLSTGFRFVASVANKNIKEFQKNLNIKRFYKSYKEMLEKEDLDILVTSKVDLDIIQHNVKNGIKLILYKKDGLSNELVNLCDKNNIILKNFDSFEGMIYGIRNVINVREL